MSGNLQLCLKKQFHWDVFLGNVRNFSNSYSQKQHIFAIVLSFFITYFANLILFIHLQNCRTKYMQRHISSLRGLRCGFWWKYLKTVNPEAFSGPSRIFKMELFAEKVKDFELLIIFVKSSILDFWLFWNVSDLK